VSTLFFDQVSLGFALRQLEEEILGPCFWAPATHRQTQFLIWYQNNRDELTSDLSNQAMASLDDHEELNLFLKRRDCGAMFRPFDGVSVASVIDLLVDWPLTADITSISRLESADSQQYVALKLLPDCVQIYDVPGYTNPLAVIETRTGCQLWIMAISQPKDGLELALTAQQIRQAGKKPVERSRLRPCVADGLHRAHRGRPDLDDRCPHRQPQAGLSGFDPGLSAVFAHYRRRERPRQNRYRPCEHT